MNFIFDLYGTLVDIWTDESRPELWEGIALLLGDGEERAASVRLEYLALCKEAKKDETHEIDLLGVFENMLLRREVDKAVAPSLASEFRRLSMVRLARFEGVSEMLSDIKAAGGRVFLLSNAQSCFTVDELHLTELYDLFDGIIISSDVGVKKPDRRIFDIAFSRFSVTAEESIYVGNDMRDDILGASEAGMRTVYIKTEQSGSYPDIDLPTPTFTVKNHSEMRSLLLSLLTKKG